NPNFLNGATVTIGGNNVPATVVDSTHVTFVPPKHLAGAVNVTVVNGDGQAASNTLTNAYTYNKQTITTVTPNSGIPNGGGSGTIMNLVPAGSLQFSSKISGYISIVTAGLYTLYTASDDGTIMWLGDPGSQGFVKVVDNNFAQGVTERSGQVYLGTGLHK